MDRKEIEVFFQMKKKDITNMQTILFHDIVIRKRCFGYKHYNDTRGKCNLCLPAHSKRKNFYAFLGVY